jgi:hypothetical protein
MEEVPQAPYVGLTVVRMAGKQVPIAAFNPGVSSHMIFFCIFFLQFCRTGFNF